MLRMRHVVLFMIPVAMAAVPASAMAQRPGSIAGQVTEADRGTPLGDARVFVLETGRNGYTDDRGRYRLDGVRPGRYRVRVVRIGYRPDTAAVTVTTGAIARLDFALAGQAITLPGIQVSALRPDLRPQAGLEREDLRRLNSRDGGELLRAVPGANAVRRGPMGLDPVVRGLRETEVGVYVDGTRMFPAGPARMDSPMSHYDPTGVRKMEVVKGPYALTWGAGNLSAIRVTTEDVFAPTDRWLHGFLLAGYEENLGAEETSLDLQQQVSDGVYLMGHGAWRQGDDYTTGDGTVVPADYSSAEGRGKLGLVLAPGSRLTLAGGYQGQGRLDNPGNLLDATYFHTTNLSARWQLDRGAGLLRHVEALAYLNNVRHAMNNDNKPTAQPNPDRMPPFALDVGVTSKVNVAGGRIDAELAPPDWAWRLEVGGDVYRAYRDATRTVDRRDSGMHIFTDLMWPGASIVDGGAFVRGTGPAGGFELSWTVRTDFVHANADTASDFFRENVSTDLAASETNLGGAFTITRAFGTDWSASIGVGSVARTADATERYSDRVPSSKAQTSAEFVGNPALAPERNTQADLWIDGTSGRFSLHLNGFVRRVGNYITIAPTTLPKRLPLSPPTVYRYVNGSADFAGFEVSPAVALTDAVTLGAAATYLHGQDTELDEPALGVTPFTVEGRLRVEPPARGWYLEGSIHRAARQDRVASARGEIATPGYTTLDLRAGVSPVTGFDLRGGVLNLTDEAYANHLNARNPFTGTPIEEPGRVVFVEASMAW